MTYRDQRIGKQAQDLAETALLQRGANFAMQIHTPYRVIQDRHTGRNRMIFAEKAIGDIIGSIPVHDSSLSFLLPFVAEVKYSDDDSRLIFSRLQPHQVERLNKMAELGWAVFLVWVNVHGVFVLSWPIAGFKRGKSLSISQAEENNIAWLPDVYFRRKNENPVSTNDAGA